MKTRYVKPEMVIEEINAEGMICTSINTSSTPYNADYGQLTKDRLDDLIEEDCSSNAWEDGLW